MGSGTPETIWGRWKEYRLAEFMREDDQILQPIPDEEKSSIRCISSFFKIKKLRLSVSFNRRDPSISGVSHVFSFAELRKDTDCFERLIGVDDVSRVYRGKLDDGRMVAVKLLVDNLRWVKDFTNEVRVHSKLRHPNIVSLYGCTDPRSQKLLLVYEFVPNGTVNDHLQNKLSPLSWIVRIRIAIETVSALMYLHSLKPSVIHRDVKTSNILLDNELHAKLADFGMCCPLPLGKTSVTTKPEGSEGYQDPDYKKSGKLTAQTDVYSFGVVLFELISGMQAVDVTRVESEIYLSDLAIDKIRHNKREELIDPYIGYHEDCENYISENKWMIDSVADLAWLCLETEVNRRPSMKEVLSTLMAIIGPDRADKLWSNATSTQKTYINSTGSHVDQSQQE